MGGRVTRFLPTDTGNGDPDVAVAWGGAEGSPVAHGGGGERGRRLGRERSIRPGGGGGEGRSGTEPIQQ